ncbi:MAG: sulfatase-like hydrolase/transferase [Thermoanaerobaculia bacterium]|nr:sulfatase-like hydrolase/transferase [Thermoanaerobaculia bacterium]
MPFRYLRSAPAIVLAGLLAACSPGSEEGARPADGAAAREAPSADSADPGGPAGRERSVAVDDVLLITIDTLRADVLGYAGHDAVTTPNIDALAETGVVFSRAHAHNVVTLPSHANILTGRYPYEHGIRDNSGFTLDPAMTNVAERFAAAGFATGAVVGAFPLSSKYGLDRGFDLYDDDYPKGWDQSSFFIPERRGDEVVRRGLAWWERNAGERRFLWIHLYDPHAPYEPLEPWASRYADDPYLGEVSAVDAYLAPLLEAARGTDARDADEKGALIVFTADHGESLGDHGELTHGFFAYQPTLAVPLVLWAPGLDPGVDERLARHVDLVPTMLEAAGLELPRELPGRSLWRAPAAEPMTSYLEALSPNLNRGWAPLRGLVRGFHKYISLPIPELYDLAADPDESENLVRQERRIVAELRDLMPQESEWPPARQEVSEGEQAMLLALGYLSGDGRQKQEWTAADDPKNLVELDRKLHRVIELHGRGDLPSAERLAREVIAVRPMAVAYTLLGEILNTQGKLEEAVEVLERAIESGYAQTASVRELALTLSRLGRHQRAIDLMRPLGASSDPANLNTLGSVLAEAGRTAEARQVLERVLALEPRNPMAHEVLALAALNEGDWQATMAHARRALELDDSSSLAWNYLGGALYNLGRPREAIEAWERSVERDPTNFDALFNLAVVAGEIGDAARARQALQRFVAEAPPALYAADIERARGWLAGTGR